ncbi:hypothetical protein DdX_04118 [Ditylenchus destructor]|uniref:Uncharacterized protein n=1 Tax=Ditylenchus destructor TaxID=166010 RepID=A0AAD4R8L1_9BILA|nr:hypothetical protein DdX_04118 [Ditylenchus destructor]
MLYTRMHNSQSSPNCAEVPTASESDDRFEMAPLLLPSTPPRSSLADTAAILLANHRQSVATTMVLTDNVAHRPLLFHKRPQKQRLFTESELHFWTYSKAANIVRTILFIKISQV